MAFCPCTVVPRLRRVSGVSTSVCRPLELVSALCQAPLLQLDGTLVPRAAGFCHSSFCSGWLGASRRGWSHGAWEAAAEGGCVQGEGWPGLAQLRRPWSWREQPGLWAEALGWGGPGKPPGPAQVLGGRRGCDSEPPRRLGDGAAGVPLLVGTDTCGIELHALRTLKLALRWRLSFPERGCVALVLLATVQPAKHSMATARQRPGALGVPGRSLAVWREEGTPKPMPQRTRGAQHASCRGVLSYLWVELQSPRGDQRE